MTALLQVRDLVVARDGRRMVGPVSTGFEGSAFVGIIGANGAGKTTFLKALAGVLAPTGGDVLLDGRPIASWNGQGRARRIGFLPQERDCAWPLTVERVAALGRLPHVGGVAEDEAAVDAALAAAEVTDLRHRRMDRLSGGERARVLVARVLAGMPRVILADEPASGLDPGHALRILDVLKERALGGALVVAAIHDLTLAARTCDRILLLHEGRCIADGTAREVLTPEHLEPAFGIRARTFEHEGRLAVLALDAKR